MDNHFILNSVKAKAHNYLIILLFIFSLLTKLSNSDNEFYIYSNISKKNVTENAEILDVLDYNKNISDKYKVIYAESFDNFKEKFNKIIDVHTIKLVK